MDVTKIAADHRWLAEFGSESIAAGWNADSLVGHAHQWVPIASSIDAGVLFVDHRPGPTYGHVYEMGIGSGVIDGTFCGATLTAFFDTVTGALNTGTELWGFRPKVYESELSGQVLLTWVPPSEDV